MAGHRSSAAADAGRGCRTRWPLTGWSCGSRPSGDCNNRWVRLTRRQMILSGSLMFASACTRPGSSSAPQRFGTGLSAPNVQVLDRQIMLTVPPGAVDPATISSFKDALGVKVTVVDGALDALTDVGQADVTLTDDVMLTALIAQKLVEPLDRSLVANTKLLLPP